MAYRLKLIIATLLLTVGCANVVETSPLPNANCSVNNALDRFLEIDSRWAVVRMGDEFVPILDIGVFDSELWVSTYGADFFPADIKVEDSSLQIENITFRRPSPKRNPGDPGVLVEPYKQKNIVFQLLLELQNCEVVNQLKLKIKDLESNETEIYNFTKIN